MTKTDFAKMAVSFVVGSGVNRIVKAIIKNNIDPTKVTDKVAVECATFVLSALVASKAKKYTDEMIDNAIAQWQKVTNQIQEARSEL